MGQKGVSDLIAAILVIAVVIVIGVMVVSFTQKFAGEEREKSACISDTNFIIDGVDYSPETGMLKIKITNHGKQPLWGFGVYLYSNSDVKRFDAENVSQGGISEGNMLGREEEAYIMVNITDGPVFGTITEITVSNKECPSVITNAIKGIGF